MASKKDSAVEKSVDLAQDVNVGEPVNGEDVDKEVILAVMKALLWEEKRALHRPQRRRFPRSKTVVGPSVDHTGKPIWWKCRSQNWFKTIVARATCSPLSTF